MKQSHGKYAHYHFGFWVLDVSDILQSDKVLEIERHDAIIGITWHSLLDDHQYYCNSLPLPINLLKYSTWNWICRLARSYRNFDCCSFDPAWSLQGESWNFRKQKLLQAINVSHKEKLKLLLRLLTNALYFFQLFFGINSLGIQQQNSQFVG